MHPVKKIRGQSGEINSLKTCRGLADQFPQDLIQQSIHLLEVWPGPGKDLEGLEAVACILDQLSEIRDPWVRTGYRRVARSWRVFIRALQTGNPKWPQKRAAVISALQECA